MFVWWTVHHLKTEQSINCFQRNPERKLEEENMKICLAVVIALVVIQMVNAQHEQTTLLPICPKCDIVCQSEEASSKVLPTGCPPCNCPPTCRNVNCSKDEKCVLEPFVCVLGFCPLRPTCVPINETTATTPAETLSVGAPNKCEPVMCMIGCQPNLGPDGCPICDCKSQSQRNCTNVTCPDGLECKMSVVTCNKPPCPEFVIICVEIRTSPPCPDYRCEEGCVSTPGPNGCPTCVCPRTCKEMNCTSDEECVMAQIRECFGQPCYPTPICVPRNDSCRSTPNTDICGKIAERWFYDASTDSCPSFSYFGCTPSPNTYLSKADCNSACKNPGICVHCDDDCYTYKTFDNRPKCVCPDPCKGFNCTDGEVCRLAEVVCEDKEPCEKRIKPYCDKSWCPVETPCNIRCKYGLKTDFNGCPVCECCEE